MSNSAGRAAQPRPSGDSPAFRKRDQYDENGVDLSLLRSNMKLSPEERARRAERARKAALRVQEIGRDSRRKPA
jgi:hypothetical protein